MNRQRILWGGVIIIVLGFFLLGGDLDYVFATASCDDTDPNDDPTIEGSCTNYADGAPQIQYPDWCDPYDEKRVWQRFCQEGSGTCSEKQDTPCPQDKPNCPAGTGACVPEFPPYAPAVFTLFPAIGYYWRRWRRKGYKSQDAR